jgi:hypothetical protein
VFTSTVIDSHPKNRLITSEARTIINAKNNPAQILEIMYNSVTNHVRTLCEASE